MAEPALAAILGLLGLDASGGKAALATRLEAAVAAGPDDTAKLRQRLRNMEGRVTALEVPGPAAGPAAGSKPAAKKEAQTSAAAPEAAEGPTAADVQTYMSFVLPKITGKPTPEQKGAMQKVTSAKKDFLAKLSKKLGGKWTVKVVTKHLEKESKAAAKGPVAVEKAAEPVAMAICKGMEVPNPRFGDFLRIQSSCKTGRVFSEIVQLSPAMAGQLVWLRARKYGGRAQGSKLAFVTLRQQFNSVQCVCAAGGDIPVEMSKYISNLPNESVVDVLAKVNTVDKPINSCTNQTIELGVEAFFCVSKSEPRLPLQIADAARSQAEIDELTAKG